MSVIISEHEDGFERTDVYEMALHEVVNIKRSDTGDTIGLIMRVPGGWIYTLGDYEDTTSTFVPEVKPK